MRGQWFRGSAPGGRVAWLMLWRCSRLLAVLAVGWAVASAATPAVVVWALGRVIAHVPDAVRHGMASTDGTALLLALVLAALLYAFSLVLDPFGSALGLAVSTRITGDLQGRLLAAVSSPVGVRHLEDPQVLDRLARAEGSLTGLFPGDAPVTWLGALGYRFAGVIGCLVVSQFHWWLGLLLLVLWLAVRRAMLSVVLRQATDLRIHTTEMRRAWYFFGVATKTRDATEMRVFGLRDFVTGRFRSSYAAAIRGGDAGLVQLHRRAAVCWVVVAAGYAIALVTVAEAARHHSITLGSLAVLLPMFAVTSTTGAVGFDDVTLARTLDGLPDVERLRAELAPPESSSGTRPAVGLPVTRIEFAGVGFRYREATPPVLDGLDLTLPAGQSTALVGLNGAGKSTLISLLCRLREPTAGRILVDGLDLADLDPAGWQRQIALIPQSPVRYPVSVFDNVAFGAWEHRDDSAGVREAAVRSGFADVVATLPDGWSTLPVRGVPGGVDLSGGQWQRLALARALFATRHGARLLVLDEPTAALDVRAEARFYQQFLELTAGLTTLLISHRFASVRRADRICVLDGGCITESGSHDELLAHDGGYARAYRLQAARFAGDRPGP